MAMLSIELVAFLIIAFLVRALTKNKPLYQQVRCSAAPLPSVQFPHRASPHSRAPPVNPTQLLHNIPFYVYPEPRHLKLLADTRHVVGKVCAPTAATTRAQAPAASYPSPRPRQRGRPAATAADTEPPLAAAALCRRVNC